MANRKAGGAALRDLTGFAVSVLPDGRTPVFRFEIRLRSTGTQSSLNGMLETDFKLGEAMTLFIIPTPPSREVADRADHPMTLFVVRKRVPRAEGLNLDLNWIWLNASMDLPLSLLEVAELLEYLNEAEQRFTLDADSRGRPVLCLSGGAGVQLVIWRGKNGWRSAKTLRAVTRGRSMALTTEQIGEEFRRWVFVGN